MGIRSKSGGARRTRLILALPLLALGIALLLWHGNTHGESMTYNMLLEQCPQTEVYPSKFGCPISSSGCARYRSDVDSTVELYRYTVSWNFGDVGILHDPSARARVFDSALKAHFPMLSADSARRFLQAEDELEAFTSAIPQLEAKLQRAIQVDLMYGCCLTDREVEQARVAVEEWAVRNSKLSIPVRFNKLQCMQVRNNSISNIIVADKESQNTLLRINRQLAQALTEAGVPVVIERSSQLPFHTALVRFQTLNNQPITPYIHTIAHSNQKVGRALSLSATLSASVRFSGPHKLHNDINHS